MYSCTSKASKLSTHSCTSTASKLSTCTRSQAARVASQAGTQAAAPFSAGLQRLLRQYFFFNCCPSKASKFPTVFDKEPGRYVRVCLHHPLEEDTLRQNLHLCTSKSSNLSYLADCAHEVHCDVIARVRLCEGQVQSVRFYY